LSVVGLVFEIELGGMYESAFLSTTTILSSRKAVISMRCVVFAKVRLLSINFDLPVSSPNVCREISQVEERK
jgi:hypothetical protein